MRDSHTTELYGYGTMWCITVVSRRLSCVVVAGSSLQCVQHAPPRSTPEYTVRITYYESKTDVCPRTMRGARIANAQSDTPRAGALW